MFEIIESENQQRQIKIEKIIEKLEAKVEFPNLRRFVNEGKIDFKKVIEIRKKAKQFRYWLQSETERDRDAIIAYHNEVAKASGFTNVGKSVLKIFGVLASVGFSVGTEIYFKEYDIVSKEMAKKFGSKAVETLTDNISKKIFKEWKPVCFGDWYRDEIAEFLKQSNKSDY
ncbi:MAG: hypothetical protein M3367_15530 [Acidobacteriota bacterium]|nr:hypothetical protein [Acidobacteriota bacterium]